MNRIRSLMLTLLSVVVVSGCGVNTGSFSNKNNVVTHIELNNPNFKITKRVTGEETAIYVMGIGGFTSKGLIASATSKMMKKANITGASKAVFYVNSEFHKKMFPPFYYRKKVIVSGYVVDFSGNSKSESLSNYDDIEDDEDVDEEEYEEDEEFEDE